LNDPARLLEDRQRLILALSDAVDRLALDRETPMLGFPESREERLGRALLDELRAPSPDTARESSPSASAIPPPASPPGGHA
jgi:hypothetical protein